MQNMCTILKKVPGPLGQLLKKKKRLLYSVKICKALLLFLYKVAVFN